jgi:nucleoid DNA-binding protein
LLEKRSGMTKLDSLNAINALNYILADQLASGNRVNFGRLGKFYLSITSDGSDDEFGIDPKTIRVKKIHFNPGKEIKKVLAEAKFVRNFSAKGKVETPIVERFAPVADDELVVEGLLEE